MAMGLPVILQIVGYQNSGKTTVITKLLQCLSKKGIHAGVLKHHGHSGHLNFNDAGKDTERHRTAGAFMTGVSSSGGSVLSMNTELTLDQGIRIYDSLNMDCILIEGYKNIQHPRIVLCRDYSLDQELLNQSHHMVACISLNPLEGQGGNIPFFLWKDEEKWLDFLVHYIESKSSKERLGHETF
ncbi:molybdopterin-guanine dinucleotide biosynthesis protein MobB [Fictibacillus barbaricus]|nr:molybdopterin-guanine dinucleotide biosynthesis protein MobB [Fictibacillus barbaricus]